MNTGGGTAPSGSLGLTVIRKPPARELTFKEVTQFGMPTKETPPHIAEWRRKNRRHLARGFRKVAVARALKLPHFYGQLFITVFRANGLIDDYGLASLRVVTDTGVGFIVDAFQNIVELENMKFHGLGTGSTAEAASQTALVTELTTEYNPNSTRATGSTTENAANVYRTVGTNTVDASAAVTEHAILSQAATGGGVMLDRSVFSVINLANGDSLQSTYDFTINSGS